MKKSYQILRKALYNILKGKKKEVRTALAPFIFLKVYRIYSNDINYGKGYKIFLKY